MHRACFAAGGFLEALKERVPWGRDMLGEMRHMTWEEWSCNLQAPRIDINADTEKQGQHFNVSGMQYCGTCGGFHRFNGEMGMHRSWRADAVAA